MNDLVVQAAVAEKDEMIAGLEHTLAEVCRIRDQRIAHLQAKLDGLHLCPDHEAACHYERDSGRPCPLCRIRDLRAREAALREALDRVEDIVLDGSATRFPEAARIIAAALAEPPKETAT